jgi:hypothetical protein
MLYVGVYIIVLQNKTPKQIAASPMPPPVLAIHLRRFMSKNFSNRNFTKKHGLTAFQSQNHKNMGFWKLRDFMF